MKLGAWAWAWKMTLTIFENFTQTIINSIFL